ncbi:MAG: NADPH:quinone oxidoreductase [Caldilineae bacterium]|nr:MAG: NADPH:quinone oxidoreductase [Caldilineae bacterium]
MYVQGYRIHRWGAELQWEQFAIPGPGPGEVRIRVEACGVGLTVLNCMRGDLGDDPALLPRVPGHEIVGRVESAGEGVIRPRPGQRVMAYFYLSCGHCLPCRSGRDANCQNLAGQIGVHRDGGYASHVILPAENALPLPDSIPPLEATAIPDAVATPLHVCKSRARLHPGDRVAVIGAGGGVGIHMIQMARLFGASVAGLEVAESKLAAIEEMGATPVLSASFDALDLSTVWGGAKPTVVIDLVGTTDSLRWGVEALATGGRMVVLTTFRRTAIPLEPRRLVMGEISLLGSRYASKAELMEAAALVAGGRIRPVVSACVPPEEVNRLHQALQNGTLLGRGAIDWTAQTLSS